MRIPSTRGFVIIILMPVAILSLSTPPLIFKKQAMLPFLALIRSKASSAKPSPLTMQPMFPSNSLY